MRYLLCLPLLFASFAFADEATDRDAIRGVIASLNDPSNDASQHSAAFAVDSDAPSELARLRQLHPSEFRVIGPPTVSSVRTIQPVVVISKEPWGEARIDFSPIPTANTTTVNRPIAFVGPDVAARRRSLLISRPIGNPSDHSAPICDEARGGPLEDRGCASAGRALRSAAVCTR